MEWLKQLIEAALKGKVSDETKIGEYVNGLIDSIKKELGKHFVPKDDFNDKNNELKETKAKMDELQKKVEELGKSGEDVAKMKSELEKVNTEFATYKQENEKRENNRKKASAIEKGLKSAKASDDAIDLLISQFDLDKITLDNKGNIVDWEDHLKPVKESRKTLFGEVKTETGKPNNGGKGGGGSETVTKQQLIDKYNEAEKARNVALMMQLQHQIKNLKE